MKRVECGGGCVVFLMRRRPPRTTQSRSSAASDVYKRQYEHLAEGEVMIAHCPRSNLNLGCPLPDVRRMLDMGLKVGLGMDSPASSGPIDMFAEMRAMMTVSYPHLRAHETVLDLVCRLLLDKNKTLTSQKPPKEIIISRS